MPLRRLVISIFTIVIVLVSIIGWYAVDFSLDVAAFFPAMPASPTTTLAAMWVVLVVIILLAGILFDRVVVRPLLDLKERAAGIGAGNFTVRFEKISETEIGELQAAFNSMAENLAQRDSALLDRERRFSSLFQRIPDAVFVFDIETLRFEEINQATQDLFGYSPEEFCALTVMDISAQVEDSRNALVALKAGKLETPTNRMLRRKDGSTFVAEIFPALFTEGGRGKSIVVIRNVTEAMRAQEELLQNAENLRTSRDLLRSIVENIPIRVFWKDENLRYLGCNTLFARDAGMSCPEDLLGKDDFQMGWREQADLYRADDRRVMGSDTPKLSYDEPQTTPDGRTIWLRTSKVPLHEAEGKVRGILGIYEDITKHKLAELALTESEDQLKQAQRIAHLGSWTLDLVTNELKWSDEAYRICEAEPETFGASYEAFLDFVHPDDREFVDKAFRDSVKNRTPYDVEHRLLMRDGRVKWVNERGRTTYDQRGNPIRSTGTALDITMRKEAEAKLEDTLHKLEFFRRAMDQSNDLIFVSDAETGLFIDVNEAACARLGYSREEFLRMSVKDIEADLPKDFSWSRSMEELRRSGGETIHGKTVCKDGTAFPVEVSVKYVALDRRDVVIAVTRDITERIETERALRYAQKIDALGNLAGGIAHNMNNLLLPIMSLTHMTLKDLPEDSRAHKRLEKVVEAAAEGKALVQQIMDFSRRNTEQDKKETLDLRDAVKAALDLVMVSVPSSIDVTEDLGEPGLHIVAARDQIVTVIMNLVSNAVDAFEGKVGKLSIELSEADVGTREAWRVPGLHPGRYGKLTITDTGKGMDEKTMARVFDPFFTTKEVGEGKGLGLSTVLSIVEKYKGVISMTSTPGTGTTVVVYLPILDSPKSP